MPPESIREFDLMDPESFERLMFGDPTAPKPSGVVDGKGNRIFTPIVLEAEPLYFSFEVPFLRALAEAETERLAAIERAIIDGPPKDPKNG